MLDYYNGFLGPQGDEDRGNHSDTDAAAGCCGCTGCNSDKLALLDPDGTGILIPREYLDGDADGLYVMDTPSDGPGVITAPVLGGFGNGGTFSTAPGTSAVFMDGDVAGDTTTTATIDVNGSVSSSIEFTDPQNPEQDWFAIELEAGVTYTFFQIRDGDQPLTDPWLYLYDGTGVELANNDDILDAEGEFVSQLSRIMFTADASGTYYLGASAFGAGFGDYTVYANEGNFRPDVSLDTFANFLTDGFGRRAAWGVDTIIYNTSALSAEGAAFAVAAMQLWAEVTPLNFVEVQDGQVANLTFINDEEGAFARTSSGNGVITSSTVNISTDWLETYGTEFNSYSFQTYIHEVGHALGLGHGGPYNGSADYGIDNIFANDLWNYSVMSYNDQGEGEGNNFGTPRLVLGLNMVDILAIQDLYGVNENGTREGATVYGFNSTVGGAYDFQAFFDQGIRPPSVAIYDTGGEDILDLRNFTSDQVISLLPGSFSSIGDNTNLNDGTPLYDLLSIDRNTIIEFAIGGFGNDNIIGNDANNTLAGREGNDAILGNGGDDTIFTDDGDDVVSGGDGNDTIIGDAGNDILSGDGGDDILNGGDGDDNVNGNDGNDQLTGGDGNDSVNGGEGNDEVFGGLGNDTVSGNNGDDIVAGQQGNDTINGDAGNDQLGGDEGDDILNGGDGDDGLNGGIGNDTLNGEGGSDSIFGGDGNDRILGGDGKDFVYGEDGDDDVIGGAGNDLVFGGAGNDTVVGGTGGDQLFGGEGNDILSGEEERDVLNGNEGDDRAFGGDGNDDVYGGDGNDIVSGDAGDDLIDGGAGNDLIVGGTGTNTIITGSGIDTLITDTSGMTDTVTDFDVASDIIRVRNDAAFDSFAEMQSIIAQSGANTVITFTSGATITLEGVTASSLTASNFEFVVTGGQDKADVSEASNTTLDDVIAPDSFDFDTDETAVASDEVLYDAATFGILDTGVDTVTFEEKVSLFMADNPFFDGPMDEAMASIDLFDFTAI
ncbi:matrixin family metalloprotease [Fretibacter rubidus]|uniref:matrixin family metalloprotease n=1 Tax=Fretibacter rubidus TaxID=570162 RepID=UPI00352AE38E